MSFLETENKRQMKIFEMSQNYNDGYLAVTGCVMIAEHEQHARDLAVFEFGKYWNHAEHVTCKEIGTANDDQVPGHILIESSDG